MIRVAFIVLGTDRWIGGKHYVANLLSVTKAYQGDKIDPVLFCSNEISKEELDYYKTIKGLEIVQSSSLNSLVSKFGLIMAILLGRDYLISRLFKKHNIDSIFTNTKYLGWSFPIPLVVWIPDLQHRFLTKLFTTFGFFKREIGFRMQIFASTKVMLSSQDAKMHCERFYPRSIGKTVSIPFAVSPPEPKKIMCARESLVHYSLPDSYFFIPNQFWRHKNHLLVLDALVELRGKGVKVNMVFTGECHDHRSLEYYNEFCHILASYGLQGQVYILGKVPYDDVLSLMISSEALINPSLFEGWSTTVEEAKAYGIRIVLSDLDVHYEQLGGEGTYFDKTDPNSLANALTTILNAELDGVEEHQAKSFVNNDKKVREFSRRFACTIQSSVGASNSNQTV